MQVKFWRSICNCNWTEGM